MSPPGVVDTEADVSVQRRLMMFIHVISILQNQDLGSKPTAELIGLLLMEVSPCNIYRDIL